MIIEMMYHPACSKTKKSRDAFSDLRLAERDLTQQMVSKEEILDIARTLGVKVHDLLRPSSPVYEERSEELLKMGEEELAAVMSGEATLIKRPIFKKDGQYVIGFDEEKVRALAAATPQA